MLIHASWIFLNILNSSPDPKGQNNFRITVLGAVSGSKGCIAGKVAFTCEDGWWISPLESKPIKAKLKHIHCYNSQVESRLNK